jgi:hypothetical protein
MKAHFAAVCATAIVVLASGLAETRTAPTLHPASLARVDAITSYCKTIDPASHSEYVAKVAGMLRGHSDAEVQQDRNSREYRQAMNQAEETLGKVTSSSAVRACAEYRAER